jgi:hypothetical protein
MRSLASTAPKLRPPRRDWPQPLLTDWKLNIQRTPINLARFRCL